ncbi:MAG TPA: TonB-dependent receptor [Bryobacteraceae bacterium]|nr:TonB-dependent receptor [Bryobacteraceae bacterium]
MAPSARAQLGASAQLSGVVTDPSGGRVQNQTITLRSKETGQTRTTQTGGDGYYMFADLVPGIYEVSGETTGFSPIHVPKLELVVGQQARLDIQLQLAELKQADTVTAEPELFEPTRTELSQVIEERRVENLPINGRQFLDLVLLTPNVHAGRSNIANPATPGEPKQVDLSFAGLHESTTLILVDGANNMNRVFARSRSTPSQEAVREFRVLSESYAADLGPAAAGVVSIVTKSGTNDWHGSLYEYFRNNALDASNILAPAGFDELRQNQFGATLGGPLVRNKLFAFGSYEGQRRRESPFYSSVLLNNLDAINRQKTALGLPPEVLAGKLRVLDYDTALVRVDYQQTSATEWNFTYRFRQDRERNLPAATNQLSAPSNFRDAHIDDHALTANVLSTFTPHLLNQGLLQFAHRDFEFPSVTYEPHLQIANTLDLGRHFNAVNAARETRFEAADSLSLAMGRHTIRLGGDISTARDHFFYDPFDPAYAVFPNLNAFLGKAPFGSPFFAVTFGFAEGADGTRPAAPKGFTGPANLPTFDRVVRPSNEQTNYALFAQDQWRATPKLSINYGLRWDVDLMPSRYFEHYYKAFQPRAGVAYAVSDRVTLRAGAGYYQGQAYSLVYLIAMVAGLDSAFGPIRPGDYGVSQNTLHSPFYSNPALATQALIGFLSSGVYPNLNPSNFAPAQQFISTIKRFNHGGPYSYQWNGQMDVRVSRDWALSVIYLGVKGQALPSAIGGNVAPTNLTLPNGKADYAIAPGVPVTRTLNPLMSPLSFFFDATAQSIYHAGTASLTKSFSSYYALTVNYTLSKVIDNSSDPSLNGFPEDPYRRFLERANSKQNVPQRFTGTFLAEGPAHGWLRDFRLAFTTAASSGNYYTIYAGMDVNHDGNANTDRVGTLGRETYRGDPLVNFDLRLARRIRLGERLDAEVIAEAFNVCNTLNVTDINTVYGAANFIGAVPTHFGQSVPAPLPSFGAIRATDPPRQIQLALRLKF